MGVSDNDDEHSIQYASLHDHEGIRSLSIGITAPSSVCFEANTPLRLLKRSARTHDQNPTSATKTSANHPASHNLCERLERKMGMRYKGRQCIRMNARASVSLEASKRRRSLKSSVRTCDPHPTTAKLTAGRR